MAHYLPRKLVCERLRLNRRTSYDIVGAAFGERISSDDVIALLNRARRETTNPFAPPPTPLDYIPSDLLTADELAAELTESHITAHDLLNWTRRTKNIAPH